MNVHDAVLSGLYVLRDIFLNPLLYLGFLLAFWDLRRTSMFERKFFGIRATRPLRLTIIRGAQGLIAGLVLSAVLIASGITVGLWEVVAITILGLVLAAIQVRFLSPVYGVAILALVSEIARRWAPHHGAGVLGAVFNHLRSFHAVGWSAVLSGVLIAEAVLVLAVRKRAASPVVSVSRRGRGIGALWVQLAFMVPLVIPTTGTILPTPGFAHTSIHLLWSSSLSSFGLLGVPVLAGFSGLFDNLRPRVAIRQTASMDIVSALIAAAGAYLGTRAGTAYAAWTPWLVILVREGSRWWLDHRQSLADPLFAPADEGVMVLAVLTDSWAARLGVQPGDTITRVNSVPVHSQYDLHFALNQNPAYAKLEVVDGRGELRFVNHTVYEGERTQLGLIFAPDGQSARFVKVGGSGLLQSLYARLSTSSVAMSTGVSTVSPLSPTTTVSVGVSGTSSTGGGQPLQNASSDFVSRTSDRVSRSNDLSMERGTVDDSRGWQSALPAPKMEQSKPSGAISRDSEGVSSPEVKSKSGYSGMAAALEAHRVTRSEAASTKEPD